MESLVDDVPAATEAAQLKPAEPVDERVVEQAEEEDDFPAIESLVDDVPDAPVVRSEVVPTVDYLLEKVQSVENLMEEIESQIELAEPAAESAQPPAMSWANVVATAKPRAPEPTEEEHEEVTRTPRPLPTLLVVGDVEETEVPKVDPQSFNEWVGRRERRRRKWRSSQSESQDYSTDEEHPAESQPAMAVPVEAAVPESIPEQEPDAVEPVAALEAETPVVEPIAPEIVQMEIKVESPQEEEEVEPIGSFRPVKEKKSGRVSIPVRETEQRRKRSRLSESEKEALDIAEAIEKGEPIPDTTTPALYYNLFADSWPDPFYFFIRDAESRWKSERPSVVEIPSEQPVTDLDDPVASVDDSAVQSDAAPLISDVAISVTSPDEPKADHRLSWAALVAAKTPEEQAAPELVDPYECVKRCNKTPVLVVVGDETVREESPVPEDPNAFLECVSRRERKRRKWRSSQSESQDAGTDEEGIDLPSSAPCVEQTISEVAEAEAPLVVEQQKPKEHVTFSDDVETVPAEGPRERCDSKSKRVPKVAKELKDVERKRQRSRLSESEKEALTLADAIETGMSVPEGMDQQAAVCSALADSFWNEKISYSDAEKLWQESLAAKASGKTEEKKSKRPSPKRDGRSPAPDSGSPPSPPQPPADGDGQGRGLPVTQHLSADLPAGLGTWSDESTYLAVEQPADRKMSPDKVGACCHNQPHLHLPCLPAGLNVSPPFLQILRPPPTHSGVTWFCVPNAT